ncbi:MAG: DNA-directed RNA polymerase [Alectoria sarmentosa]|nr:MAG: DNA-directed RNA polymerase [Alectoria sarmentosa]
MFVRASKRSLHREAYKQSCSSLELLRLPFLCPALLGQPNGTRKDSSYVRAASSKHDLGCPSTRSGRHPVSRNPLHRRRLASAAAAIQYEPENDAYVPWAEPSVTNLNYQPGFDSTGISALRQFDPNTPPLIVKEDTLATYPKKFRVKNAITGDLNELHQNLHACLQVGRLERAAALVRRLNQIYNPDAAGLLAAHSDYVREVTNKVVQTKDQRLLKDLQIWFEVDLKRVGINPNTEIYAQMIRASSQSLGASRERAIRRYQKLADEAGFGAATKALWEVDVEDSPPIFTSRLHEHADANITDSSHREPGAAERAFAKPADELQAVKATEQKGSGLSTLKKSLGLFGNNQGADLFSGREAADGELSAEERQRLLENNTIKAAMDRWRAEDAQLKGIGINSNLASSSVGAMMWKWHEALVPLIKEDVIKSKEAEGRETKKKADEDLLLWGPYLQSLLPEKLSAVTILAAMKILSTEGIDERGMRIHHVVTGIGSAVQAESVAEQFGRKKKGKTWRESNLVKGTRELDSTGPEIPDEKLQNVLRGRSSRVYDSMEWTQTIKVKIGAVLLSHLMDVAKVQVSRKNPKTGIEMRESQPVFFHTFQYMAGKRVGVVRLNTAILETLAKAPVTSAIAKYLPMVAEPKSWIGFREGGFYEHSVPVIRLNSNDVQSKRYAITAAENGDMSQVFAGLDVLAKTQWKVNSFVFKVMLDAWNTEEAIAKIPPANPPSDKPHEPPPSAEPKARRKWMRAVRDAENQRSGLKSQRCFQNFQLEVARAYLNETFYFPHNCDFRGRAYPMAPFLNHMGADNARGLLLFAQGKELTDSGLWWLKIHLANVHGYDKANFEERLRFTENHLAEIYDSVNNPLDGNRWWLKAEDPWQCLAACNELKAALDMPDPTRYVCHLAIHQDGTCNGLQHYAALGGDVVGAQQVNLEPGDRPSDIYTAVAEMVKAEIANEAAQGDALAQQLDGRVTRKVVKQTVMTNVYGVTFTGARRQVLKQLDELKPGLPDTFELNRLAAASYVARKIFKSLSTMFNGAHDIQYWLTDCAARISDSISAEQAVYIEREAKGEKFPHSFKLKPLKGRKDELLSFKSSVIWTTPLKMPVVQPYRKASTRRIDTNLQSITIMHRTAADPVHKVKQLQAFPPNFIHSLDATHMFLTALKCHEVGLTFASIHDSFWTHAGDVNMMNRIIRDAFIRMHSEDIVGRLAAEFNARYKGYMHLASVFSKSPVGRKILLWRRNVDPEAKKGGVAVRKRDELILERRRLVLLTSEDPREREEGEAMVTPAKLFAEAADERALAPSDVKPATIGGMGPASSRSAKLKANQRLEVGDMANTETVLGNGEAEGHELDGTVDSRAATDDAIAETLEETTHDAEDGSALLTETTEPGKKASAGKDRKIWVWLPLKFAPVPKKGAFDVSRLKDSQYFFS